MATCRWQGKAKAVAQVNTWAFTGTWKGTDTVTIVIGNKSYVYTLPADDTAANVVAALVTAWNALDATVYPEFAEMTADASTSTTFRLTADTLGKSFSVTLQAGRVGGSSSAAIAGGTTATAGTAATANAGPKVWSTAANWSGAAAPADGDDIYVDETDDEIIYDVDQSGSVSPASLTIGPGFTGKIGLPAINTDATAYAEYRAQYLAFGSCTTVNINCASQRVKLSLGNGAISTVNVVQTGTGEDPNLEALLLKMAHASSVLNVRGQSQVGVARFGGETTTLATLRNNQANVRCGPGTTLAVIVNDGGTLELNSAVGTSLTQQGGQSTINGTGAVTGLTVRKNGYCVYNTSGTLGGAPVLSEGSILDFDQDSRAKTVTNPIDLFSGAKVRDNNKVVASLVQDFNGFVPDLSECGENARYTRAAVA